MAQKLKSYENFPVVPSTDHHAVASEEGAETIFKMQRTVESLEERADSVYQDLVECEKQRKMEEERNLVLAKELQMMNDQSLADANLVSDLNQRMDAMNVELEKWKSMHEKLLLKGETSDVKHDDQQAKLDAQDEKLKSLEKARMTWLSEMEEKSRLSDRLSSASDRVARFQEENAKLLGNTKKN